MQKNKKFAIINSLIIMLLITAALTGCNLFNRRERCEAWHYVENRSATNLYRRNGIYLISLRVYSILTEDNVLHIPTHVNGQRVVGLGRLQTGMAQSPRSTFFNPDTQTEKIVVPCGVPIGSMFWGNLQIPVELLSLQPTNIRFWIPGGTGMTFGTRMVIIPDGTYEIYRELPSDNRVNSEIPFFYLIERTDWINRQN